VGPAGRSNPVSREQSGLKNESQPDAPPCPYPRSSRSPARYLQTHLNASCTTCSPIAGPNSLPCVGFCVPYKFSRNPRPHLPCSYFSPPPPLAPMRSHLLACVSPAAPHVAPALVFPRRLAPPAAPSAAPAPFSLSREPLCACTPAHRFCLVRSPSCILLRLCNTATTRMPSFCITCARPVQCRRPDLRAPCTPSCTAPSSSTAPA
jgi:hypothetical protein